MDNDESVMTAKASTFCTNWLDTIFWLRSTALTTGLACFVAHPINNANATHGSSILKMTFLDINSPFKKLFVMGGQVIS
jgi:hypothetical protein